MLLGAISLYGGSELKVISGRQNSEYYCNTLQSTMVPLVTEVFGEQTTWVFPQDNAPVHTSKFTQIWLIEHSIRTLPWPASSLDVNTFEIV